MPDQRILIIEDDPGAADAVAEKAKLAGFQTHIESTGMGGLSAFERFEPALVVLDLTLPDMDGVEICRTIRGKSRVPIIMLTAKVEEVDRIIGLEMGADDYVTKPFSPKELISRIRAVLRRTEEGAIPTPGETNHSAAGIDLDERRQEVTVNGKQVQLTPIEFKLLLTLMRHAGQVMSRERLTERVWGYEGYSSNLLEIHIGNLRKKIEEDPRHPRRLITVRGYGYKIMREVNG